MKIGWIVWNRHTEFYPDDMPEFYEDGKEPEYCHKKIRIVYLEVVNG